MNVFFKYNIQYSKGSRKSPPQTSDFVTEPISPAPLPRCFISSNSVTSCYQICTFLCSVTVLQLLASPARLTLQGKVFLCSNIYQILRIYSCWNSSNNSNSILESPATDKLQGWEDWRIDFESIHGSILMSMLFWCLILNDDEIEQLSAVVPSHKPNFDTFKQSNLSFFCGSSGSKLASLASWLCFRWWPCWELLHDFMDASYFKGVVIYHCILWNSLRKRFCHFQCTNADFVWSAPSFFGGSIVRKKKLIALIAHHPFSTTRSNMFQLPPQGDKKQHTWPTLPSQHRILKLHPAVEAPKTMKKSSCSQPAQLLQRGHLTIQVAAQATHVCCGAEWTLLSLYFDQMKVSDRITSTAWCNRQRRKWTLNFGPSMGWFAKWPSANMKHHLNSQGVSSWKRLEPFPSTPFMCSTWPPCPLKWAACGMKSNDLRWFSGAQENQRKWKHWRILLHLPLEPTLSQYSNLSNFISLNLLHLLCPGLHPSCLVPLANLEPTSGGQSCSSTSAQTLRPWRWMATYLLRSADGILLLPSLQGWRTIKSCWKSQQNWRMKTANTWPFH